MVIAMTITGRYERDENFTTVYADNRIYTIARNTGDWGCLPVGGTSYVGGVLTQERYNDLASACSEKGTFELSEEE